MSILKSKEILQDAMKNNNSVIEVKGELLKKLQQIELEMLKNINSLCYENDIDLILGGGTLLGAVRHKGFIPWDDDIDLNLQRKYVNQFVDLVNKKYSEIYLVQYRNIAQSRPFIKIRKKGTILDEPDTMNKNEGVSIDIFIIEDTPKNILLNYIYGVVCTFRLFIASCSSFYWNKREEFITIVKNSTKSKINYCLKNTIGFLFSSKSYNQILIDNDKYFSKYLGSNSKYISMPTGRKHYFGELYKREVFEDLIELEFEGIKCKAPKDYDSYLRNLYGDNYMQIPPEDKREHHYVLDIKL